MKKYILHILFLLISLLPLASIAASVQPFVDVLDWRAAESNTAWATTFTFPNNTTQVTQNTINFNNTFGLKLGFSYFPENNFWDTKFYWTYFPSSAKQSI